MSHDSDSRADAQVKGDTMKILLDARVPLSHESIGFVYAARYEIETLESLVDHVLSGRLEAVHTAGDPKKNMAVDDFALKARGRKAS